MAYNDWPGREDLAPRARRRWLWVVALSGLAGGFGAAVIGPLLDHHPSRPAKHADPVVPIVILGVTLIVLVAFAVWYVRRGSKTKGWFSVPIVSGLPRRQRREVTRDILRGTPSSDHTIALVERETAQRISKVIWLSGLVYLAFLALSLYEALTNGGLLFWLGAVLFLGLLVYSFLLWRGSRLLLDFLAARGFGDGAVQSTAVLETGASATEARVPLGVGESASEGTSTLVETLRRFRVWIVILAIVMSGLAIDRTIQAHGNHGIGEGILAIGLWVLAAWTFRSRSAQERSGADRSVR